MNTQNIPNELKSLNNWVAWKAVKDKETGKVKKIPFDPKTGKAASTTNPDSWGDFETARMAVDSTKKYAGLGFVFPLDGSIIGIDLDNKQGAQITSLEDCHKDIRDYVVTIKSYTEISPSGTGLHIIVSGGLKENAKHRAKMPCGWDIEIYDRGRYFTFTGNVIKGYEQITQKPEEIAWLCGWIDYWAKAEANKGKDAGAIDKENKSGAIDCDINELLRRTKSDAKFNTLWAGDYSAYKTKDGQPDHSQADFALCLKLAFYSNAGAIDGLFRQSGLMRDKWDKKHGDKTYGEKTIEGALKAWNGESWVDKKSVKTNSTVGGSLPQANPVQTDKPPQGFKLTERGLMYETANDPESRTWISGALKITARTRNIATGTGWGKLLEFVDPDGLKQSWAMPMRELAGKTYIQTLYDMGLDIGTGDTPRALLTRYIQEYKPMKTLDCVEKTGWHGGVFVLPNGCISTKDKQEAILETPLQHNPYSVAGTLEEWRNGISIWAAGNSRLVFALSTAFASPLLGLLGGEENGGFHFRGMSSEGKTVILRVASSVFGCPSDYMQRWRATAVGIEQVAVAYNDTLLCLDELGQVDPHTAGEVAYMLANGQGKLRGARTGGLRKTDKWRMLFLSTGEISLAQHMSDGKRMARAGQELRLADIPSNAGAGFGAFENLHNIASSADFAEHLTRNSCAFYGTAGRAYLQKLIEDTDGVAKRITDMRREFDALIPPTASGQAVRVARRFILVGAAGELATELGITGWRKDEAMDAAYKCMQDWLTARGGDGQKEIGTALEQVQAWFQTHAPSRCTIWHRDPTLDQTVNRAGFRRATGEDTYEYFILPNIFKTEICAGLDWRQVADWLIEREWLVPTKTAEGTKPTRAERLPGMGNTRVFRFAPGVESRDF